MKPGHYVLITIIAILLVLGLFVRGCFHCTGRALSPEPAPPNTVVVPAETR